MTPLYYSKATYDHILDFIRARHFGHVDEALRAQKWLKKRFGLAYGAALMRHGDPDRGNYESVMAAWWAEVREAYKVAGR